MCSYNNNTFHLQTAKCTFISKHGKRAITYLSLWLSLKTSRFGLLDPLTFQVGGKTKNTRPILRV